MLISAAYSVSGIRSYFSCSVIRFVSSTTFRYVQQRKSIMLQRNKSEASCLLGLEHYVEILPLIEKKQSVAMYFLYI